LVIVSVIVFAIIKGLQASWLVYLSLRVHL